MTGTGADPDDPWKRLGLRLETLPTDPVPADRAEAAVIVLARSHDLGLEVLAEQRAQRDGDPWSGQVGLPGGRRDPQDRTLTDTVLRELGEEVGLPSDAVEGPPRLFGIRRARPSGLRVAVFLGRLAAAQMPTGRVDPEEIAGTFWLPFDELRHVESRPRSTIFGELPVETVEHDGHIVWGFTLRVLRDVQQWLESPAPMPEPAPTAPTRSQAL